jgi:hypothetical protein
MPEFDPPKTRTEKKRSGKMKGGPYSAKHVRLAAAAAAATAATKAKATVGKGE